MKSVTAKFVTQIEHVGPYQIQTTSIISSNFSARIEDDRAIRIGDSDRKKEPYNISKEDGQ